MDRISVMHPQPKCWCCGTSTMLVTIPSNDCSPSLILSACFLSLCLRAPFPLRRSSPLSTFASLLCPSLLIPIAENSIVSFVARVKQSLQRASSMSRPSSRGKPEGAAVAKAPPKKAVVIQSIGEQREADRKSIVYLLVVLVQLNSKQ